MKHVHHDMICEWAKNPTRKVEFLSEDGEWGSCTHNTPIWHPESQYRFADTVAPVLRYRVALFDDTFQRWTWIANDPIIAESWEKTKVFVEWLTEWVEVPPKNGR